MRTRRPESAEHFTAPILPRSTAKDDPFTFISPLGLYIPMTRVHVRLLGPCFKTGPESTQSNSVADRYSKAWPVRGHPLLTAEQAREREYHPYHRATDRACGGPDAPFDNKRLVAAQYRLQYRRAAGRATEGPSRTHEATQRSTAQPVDRHATGRDVLLEEKCTST